MFKKAEKLRRVARFQKPSLRLGADIRRTKEKISIFLDGTEIFVQNIDHTAGFPQRNDFAVFALCALSMSHNWEIDVNFPVSESAIEQCRKIKNAYRLWSIDVLAPLRLNFMTTQALDAPKLALGIICVSGGLDSLAAAVEAVEDGKTESALLIAGADYSNSEMPGFQQLTERVAEICRKLELELIVAETNLRQVGFHWGMLHTFNLAYCLHYQSSTFGYGAFAQDNNAIQDLMRMPWGNLNVLPDLFSTESFPIKTYGKDMNRVQKLAKVLEFDESLLATLSVCFKDKKIGGNCGKCAKCLEMRITLEVLGHKANDLFEETPDMVAAVKKFRVPIQLSAVKGRMCRTSELVDALPKSELRDALIDFEARLRRRYHWLMPVSTKSR
ncbi:hypothetical protein SAMN05444003_2108 [Cognatiyoonia sediminum]|uniref:7-cyano-7-deazaguanine synthase (Queuosine biosynthesis) n=1 Tax=Cognatiyoonia sediminum TaxID=1508389 RepID=A0A1M5Q8K0_9RHOB|nr:hypothetical protein [Cognatiyoonia sediminum]SHH10260.1 hypothetical protein SAMN05444003_2108 [Cognatiyoonia sediminum]